MSFWQIASTGLSLYQGMKQKSANDKASALALQIGEENAKIIERGTEIADRQIVILKRALDISNERKTKAFGAFQGKGTAIYGGGGIELSRGAPVNVARSSAAEFEYELAIDAYNTEIAIFEQEDKKVETGMRAKVSRMGGQAQASAYQSAGTAALLSGLGTSLTKAEEYKMFSGDYWNDFANSF
jgi:hypothetical protein